MIYSLHVAFSFFHYFIIIVSVGLYVSLMLTSLYLKLTFDVSVCWKKKCEE